MQRRGGDNGITTPPGPKVACATLHHSDIAWVQLSLLSLLFDWASCDGQFNIFQSCSIRHSCVLSSFYCDHPTTAKSKRINSVESAHRWAREARRAQILAVVKYPIAHRSAADSRAPQSVLVSSPARNDRVTPIQPLYSMIDVRPQR